MYHIVILYIEEVANWRGSMDGQAATFDMDVVEQLHGIITRGRLGRMLLSIMNLKNICLNKKNKILEFLTYLKQKYTNIYDILNDYIFTKYKLKQHIIQELKKRKAIRKGVLGYYCQRVGMVGVKKVLTKSNSHNTNA